MAELIRDRYEPLSVLGKGAQGEVLLARDHLHQRRVALKVRRVTNRDAVLAEARVLLDLTPHPGMPLVREDFFEGGRYYLVMDWVEGRSLRNILDERDAVSLGIDDAVRWLEQVAEALEHLHSHNPPVIHADVKPENIVITPSGRAVLVDFGLAHSRRAGGATAGTPRYVAPELAAGDPPSPAADVFSLGVTAFELITGAKADPGARFDLDHVPETNRSRVDRALRAALSLDPALRPAGPAAFVEALRPADTPNNLPASVTSFVGRAAELAHMKRLVRETRVLTLTGAGGCGKTRLSLEVARDLLARFPDGVWLVELAPLARESLVASAIARAVGVAEEPGRALMDGIVAALREGRRLLVVDNAEHVIDSCAELSTLLLRACPGLTLLVTSREPLRIEGETVWRVPSLGVAERGAPAEAARRAEAVELFCDRARQAQPRFRLDDDAAPSVIEICSRLDGMPLALELAAASLRTMTLESVATGLSDVFTILTSGHRTALPRHATLRGTLDWTHELLAEDERVLLRRLAVFAGGFDPRAAERVCAWAPLDEAHIADLLPRLMDKSIVTAAEDDRYGMLHAVRQYALEKLDAAAEVDEARRRHRDWCTELSIEAETQLQGTEPTPWLDRLELEHDNLRAALASSSVAGDESGVRLASALIFFWMFRGHVSEGREWLESLLPTATTNHIRAKSLAAAGSLAQAQGDLGVAYERMGESLEILRGLGDRRAIGACLNNLAVVASRRGDFAAARAFGEETLGIWRELGHKSLYAQSLANLAAIDQSRGELVAARALAEEALSVCRELGDKPGVARVLNNLGVIARMESDRGLARERYEESLALKREMGDARGVSASLSNLGDLALDEGRPKEAEQMYGEALRMAADTGHLHDASTSIEGLAAAAAVLGDDERAACLFGAAEAQREVLGTPLIPADAAEHDQRLVAVAGRLGEKAFSAEHGRGRSMTLDESIALALTNLV